MAEIQKLQLDTCVIDGGVEAIVLSVLCVRVSDRGDGGQNRGVQEDHGGSSQLRHLQLCQPEKDECVGEQAI